MTISQASATANSAGLTETSMTLIDSMTLTPGAGDFIATFSATLKVTSSPSGEEFKFAIFVDGVEQAHTNRTFTAEDSIGGTDYFISTCAHIAVDAAEDVEIKYVVDGGSWTLKTRAVTLYPIDSAKVLTDQSTGDSTISSASYVTLEKLLVSSGPKNFFCLFSGTFRSDQSGSIIDLIGVLETAQEAHTQRSYEAEPSIQGSKQTISIGWEDNLPSGNESVGIEWRNSGTAGDIVCNDRSLIVYELDTENMFEAEATADDTVSNTTYTQLNSMTLTPGADDYLLVFGTSVSVLDLGGTLLIEYAPSVDGTLVADLHRMNAVDSSVDNAVQPSSAIMGLVSPGASEVVDIDWKGDDATEDRTAGPRTLLLVKEAAAAGLAGAVTLTMSVAAQGGLQGAAAMVMSVAATTVLFADGAPVLVMTIAADAPQKYELVSFRFRNDDGLLIAPY